MIPKPLADLYTKFLYACVYVAGVLIVVGILLIVVDVCIRASGGKPPGFTVAVVEYILLYFVLLTAPFLVREKGHVLTDMVFKALPPPLRKIVEKLVYLLCIGTSMLFAVVGTILMIESIKLGYMDERSVDIPYWVLYALFPLCFTMIAIEFARYLFGHDSLYEREQQLDSV